MSTPTDRGEWAAHTGPLTVSNAPAGARNRNVDGRKLTGPMQGFGQMWQKTYKVAISGADVAPTDVIEAWKDNYAEFWPKGNRFHAPLAGIKPGEVGLIDADMPGRVTLSTGVMVLFTDETSFAFMTPEGHPFAGWITFSVFEESGETWAQVEVLIRAQDPLTELGMIFGGHRKEDRMWADTLANLAGHFGVDSPQVETAVVRVDAKRQWRQIGNVRHDAALHEVVHLAGAPARMAGATFRRVVLAAAIANAVAHVAAMAILRTVIPPLIIFAVLGLLAALVAQRSTRLAGLPAVIVGALQTVGSAPFLADALAHPESPVDFLHAAWTTIAAVAMVVGGVALLRRAEGRAVTLAGGTAVAAAAALVVSIVATLGTGTTVTTGDVRLEAAGDWATDAVAIGTGQTLLLDNTFAGRHTFTVDGTGIDVEMPAGRAVATTIDLAPGSYDFFCAVPGHEFMTGTLTVTS